LKALTGCCPSRRSSSAWGRMIPHPIEEVMIKQ
jgi:hypothetical protein